MSDRFVIITGGPGAGKSTLIEALRADGFGATVEAARAIIADQVRIGGSALPWVDPPAFAELCLSWEMRSYREAAAVGGPVFFDRGLPEIPAYYEHMGFPAPRHAYAATEHFRYHRRVLVAPPWPEIYRTDAERTQTYAEAVRGYETAVRWYPRFGYELVFLPLASVETRVRFVRDVIGV